jgi:hypothetical protein
VVCGVWCVVCGVLCVVCGVLCVVCCVWCVVCGVCVGLSPRCQCMLPVSLAGGLVSLCAVSVCLSKVAASVSYLIILFYLILSYLILSYLILSFVSHLPGVSARLSVSFRGVFVSLLWRRCFFSRFFCLRHVSACIPAVSVCICLYIVYWN